MKFSVIIPNFNDKRIQRALTSVQSQDYKDIEIIVVHGGPMSQEFTNIYENYKPDKLIIEPDKGIFDALNKGIERSTGDVIYLLGADDFLSGPNIFKEVNDKFLNNRNIDGVCIGCTFINSRGKIIRKWFSKKISSSRIKRGVLPPHFSLFLKKEIYETVGLFKYKYSNNIATDTIWLIDLAISKPELNILPLNHYHLNMELGGASTGSIFGTMDQFKVIHRYASKKKEYLPFWYMLALVKLGSKLFQLRF